MARKSLAERARQSVNALINKRQRLLEQLAQVDAELTEIGASIPGLADVVSAPSKTLMAQGNAQAKAVGKAESLESLMARAKAEPAPEGTQERPPFVPHEERGGFVADGAGQPGDLAGADNMGAGRWV